jgi:hypothetical protein
MGQTQQRGSTQLLDASVTAAKLAASLNLPTNQLQDGALFLKSDGTVALTAPLSWSGTPSAGNHLANKTYVDNVALGLSPKAARVVAIVVNVALTGIPSSVNADGQTLSAGDDVLLTAQTTGSQNGPWVIAAGAWSRPLDWAAGSVQKANAYMFIQKGAVYADQEFVCTTDGAVTVDTTSTTWTQFSGGSNIVGGAGLVKTGNTLDVGAGLGIQVNADDVQIKLNGSSLNLSAGGVKISDGTAGQVMIGGAAGVATFTTLSGDISSITSGGAVTLSTGVMKTANYIRNERAAGAVNGANLTFTINGGSAVIAGSESIFLNGQLLEPGGGNDYTLNAATGAITLLIPAPSGTDKLTGNYQR